MENQKATESAGSSSGEIHERANSKTEKTHQKITLPTFEKRGIQEAKLWWRRFTQNIKMTQNIDLNIMTTDREILEYRIKDLFIWALGESAITEMTRTVRDNDPNRMDINQLYSLFRLHFIPERNKFHSRADFFGITREKHESAEDVWTRILQVEKNCEFENVTPAELIASKFLSVIGRSTGDYELKKKIRKSDMTIETITALIHEHMYDRLNDSNNSNDGKEIKHVQERPYKRKWTEKNRCRQNEEKTRIPKTKTKRQSLWTMRSTRSAECRKCKRRGHYEKMCRSMRRVQYVDKTTYSAEEDNWDYEKIQRIENTKKERLLQRHAIGQQRTNKIHHR